MDKTDNEKNVEATINNEATKDAVPSTEGVEQTPVEKSKKQKLQDMYAEMIDGYNPEDEEGSSESVMNFLKSSGESKEKIAEALKKDPRLASMFADVVSGKRGAAGSLVRYFGRDFLNAEEGSPEFDEITKAEEERKSEQERSEASAKEYNDNLEKTMPEVEKFCEGKGYKVDEFLGRIWDEVVAPICSGMYSERLCNIIDNGLNYDKDVNDAMAAGEIKGRNENIHKLKEEKGDGMPSIAGSEQLEKPKNKSNSFIKLAMQA